MVVTQVKLYNGNRRLITHSIFELVFEKKLGHAPPGTMEVSSSLVTYDKVLEEPLEIRPTPAEISYKIQELESQMEEISPTRYLIGNPKSILIDLLYQLSSSWTAQGAGPSDKKSPFDGKQVLAVVKSVDLANGTAMPDYEKAVAPEQRLYEQEKGFIQRWKIVGEYKLGNGRTTQYFAMPITGKENKGLGFADLGLLTASKQFLPLGTDRGGCRPNSQFSQDVPQNHHYFLKSIKGTEILEERVLT